MKIAVISRISTCPALRGGRPRARSDPNTVMLFVDLLADCDGFLTGAERYARLGFGLIDIMPPPDDADTVGFASRHGENAIAALAQMDLG
jgi:hypothetical protein